MEKGVMTWGGGARVGEGILGKSFQQSQGSLGGAKAYFSLLAGEGNAYCVTGQHGWSPMGCPPSPGPQSSSWNSTQLWAAG